MGKGSEWITASSGENNRSYEAHTKNLSGRKKENRGCPAGTVEEAEGCEEIMALRSSRACCENAVGFRVSGQWLLSVWG
jgi:hypothetical protein